MKTHKLNKLFVMLLILACTTLGITGCAVKGNVVGLSDYYYADPQNYSAGDAELTEAVANIDINWPVGSVTVTPHEKNTVCLSEKSEKELTEDTKLHYWLDNTTLRIKFYSSGKWDLSERKKELTVLVPSSLILGNLKVSTLSANMNLTGCAVTRSVNINTLSGELNAEFTQPLTEFEGDSTSGAFTVNAPSVSRFEAEMISGEVSLSVEKEPDFLDVDTTSGKVNLSLPAGASFTLDYDTTSGDLSSDLSCTRSAGKYVFGGGKGEYEIDTVSGGVKITPYVPEGNK